MAKLTGVHEQARESQPKADMTDLKRGGGGSFVYDGKHDGPEVSFKESCVAKPLRSMR